MHRLGLTGFTLAAGVLRGGGSNTGCDVQPVGQEHPQDARVILPLLKTGQGASVHPSVKCSDAVGAEEITGIK